MGISNILEFSLNKGCNVTVAAVDSIMTSVRLNWTLSEFFKDGGTTKFVDRFASVLGIKPANIKVVAVYTGSVVVDFHLIDDATQTLIKMGGLSQV